MARKILKGLDKFYYAKLVDGTDTVTAAASYSAPVALEGAVSVAYNPNGSIETFYADNGPFEVEETIGDQDFEVGIADVSQEILADLLGQTVTGGVVNELSTDRSPYIAFGFRAERSSGGYSYVWLYKGKFMKTPMNVETRGATVGFQPLTLTSKFVVRTYDSKYKAHTRTDATDYTTALATAWFTEVYGSTLDITLPTVSSSVPVSGSATADITAAITVTFSENILPSTAVAANFTLIQPTASLTIPITGGITLSSAVVTLAHAALSSGATYNLIVGVGIKDLAGNAMSAAHTIRFGTA
jgi:phi13 family phage major tail protein